MRKPSLDLLTNQAVDGLYEAVAAPEAWTDALDNLDRLFGSNSAHMFLWNDATNRRVAAQRSRSFAENHPEWDYFQRINPRRKILLRLPYGTPMNCADHLGDRAVSRSEYFTDYSLPAGRRYLLGTYALKQESVVTAFAVMRAPGQKPFDNGHTASMARLMPHLRRVARIDRRLRGAREEGSLAGAALDRLADAIMVVDAAGRIVRANGTAQAMFEVQSPLRSRIGRLCAASDDTTTKLRALIADAAVSTPRHASNGGGTIVLDEPGPKRWITLVAPLMPRAAIFDLCDHRLVLVIVSASGATPSLEQRLRQAFALTPAEARLAARIVDGQHLDEVCAQLGVSLPTLRTQLKSVFAKSGVRRQGELMQIGIQLGRINGA